MLYTELQIYSYALPVSADAQEYRFEATCISAGELPHTGIFVYDIRDVDNPATDTFARVAMSSDLDDLVLERDMALAASQSQYLSSYVYKQYANIDTAITAKDALRSRVNDLCWAWIQYRDQFTVDDGDVTVHPSGQPSLEEARRTTYTEAKNERLAAEAALAEADTSVSSAETALDNANNVYAIRKTYDDFAKQVLNYEFENYRTKITVEGTDAQTYRTSTLGVSLSSQIALAATNKASASSTVLTAESALTAATVARNVASAEFVAAQNAETEALAALLEVCPTFDPGTV
jgi:hypothetical protein